MFIPLSTLKRKKTLRIDSERALVLEPAFKYSHTVYACGFVECNITFLKDHTGFTGDTTVLTSSL